jgi:hypothetical protein
LKNINNFIKEVMMTRIEVENKYLISETKIRGIAFCSGA